MGMMNKHSLRMTLLGILCGGMLLLGIGIGVGTIEFSKFSFGGEVMLGNEEGVSEEYFHLSPEGEEKLYLQTQIQEERKAEIIPDESMEPGEVQVEVRYRSISDVEYCFGTNVDDNENLYTFFYPTSGGVATLMAVKDQLLKDLEDRCLHEYRTGEIEEIRVYVHPEVQDRVVLDTSRG